MIGWLRAHLRAAKFSAVRALRSPLPTLMTVVVVGISLALPACLYLLTSNLDGLIAGRDDSRQISVFVDRALDEDVALDVLADLELLPEIRRVELISRAAALEDLKTISGVGDITEMLDVNPLPVTILVEPSPELITGQALDALAQKLKAIPEVEDIRLDIVWMQRLDAMIQLVRRAMWLAALLLGLAVLLTIGNTIRLIVLNHADEIEVTNLVGGADRFIRRPFLYRGLILGLFGALVALALVTLVQALIEPRVQQLTEAYGYLHSVEGLGFEAIGSILLAGSGLGVIAAWLAVRRHLRGLRPGRQPEVM